MFGSGRSRTGPPARLLVSLIPFRDERLMRSRMVQIADAPAGRVIWLRRVTQLMAQRNLVVVRGRQYQGRQRSSIVPLFLARIHCSRPSYFCSNFPASFLFGEIDRARVKQLSTWLGHPSSRDPCDTDSQPGSLTFIIPQENCTSKKRAIQNPGVGLAPPETCATMKTLP
jgi:hypothetical protein